MEREQNLPRKTFTSQPGNGVRKLALPLLALALAVLACDLPFGTGNPVNTGNPTATNDPVPVENLVDTPTQVSVPPMPVVSAPDLTNIEFQDASNGWGIGASAILRTTDGGFTWMNVTPPELTEIGYSAALNVLNINTAWVLVPGADYLTGMLFSTSDGGFNWRSNPVPFGGGMLQFLDASTGRMLADRGAGAGSNAVELYQTSDGGVTWVSVFHNDPSQPGSSESLPLGGIKNGMTFLDANTGWVTGTRPVDGDVYLFITHDGGVSWAQQGITLPAGSETYQFMPQALIFFGSQGFLPLTIFMPSGERELTFYVTHDGGLTWNGDPNDANKVLSAGPYAFADPLHGWCWNGGANPYFTVDGAQVWGGTTSSLDLSGLLAQLDFVSAGSDSFTGWALTYPDASNHSQLYRSTDNGFTWTAVIP